MIYTVSVTPDGRVVTLRDVNELLLPEIRRTIGALDGTLTADSATIKLAERYAAAIDAADTPQLEAWALRNLGPLLLDALTELGATPAARARITKQPDRKTGSGSSKLTQLRAAHTAS